jgi:hypothetical protein
MFPAKEDDRDMAGRNNEAGAAGRDAAVEGACWRMGAVGSDGVRAVGGCGGDGDDMWGK